MRHSFGVALSVPILLVRSGVRLVSAARPFQTAARRMTLAFAVLGLGTCASCSHEGVIDNSPGLGRWWAEECLIHRPCESIKPLPPCPRETKISTLSTATTLPLGSKVTYSIAGWLQLASGGYTLVECRRSWVQHCCNHGSKKAVLVDEDGSEFELPHMGCFGDESRLCCNVDVKGQMVVATWVMRLGGWGNQQRWFFRDEVTLCAL